MNIATYESEQASNGRATETAWAQRSHLVSRWLQTSPDSGEIRYDLLDDPQAWACILRAVGAVGRSADVVRLAAMDRLCQLAQEKADAYCGERLVEECAQTLMEDADEQKERHHAF